MRVQGSGLGKGGTGWARWDESRVKQLSLSLCAGGIRSSPDPIHTTWLCLAAVWLVLACCSSTFLVPDAA